MVFELRVVDDTAERGLALVQEYNDLLTKDEGQLNLLFLSSRNTASCTTIATMLLSSRVSLLLRTKLLGLDSKSRMDLYYELHVVECAIVLDHLTSRAGCYEL